MTSSSSITLSPSEIYGERSEYRISFVGVAISRLGNARLYCFADMTPSADAPTMALFYRHGDTVMYMPCRDTGATDDEGCTVYEIGVDEDIRLHVSPDPGQPLRYVAKGQETVIDPIDQEDVEVRIGGLWIDFAELTIKVPDDTLAALQHAADRIVLAGGCKVDISELDGILQRIVPLDEIGDDHTNAPLWWFGFLRALLARCSPECMADMTSRDVQRQILGRVDRLFAHIRSRLKQPLPVVSRTVADQGGQQ